MPVFGPFPIYDNNPLVVLGTTAIGATVRWTGEASPSGITTITDNEPGIQGLTLDDDTTGGETATSTTTINGLTSTDAPSDNEFSWRLRDQVTGQIFDLVEFEVETGDARGRYTLSEIPLVFGRTYRILGANDDPTVLEGDPVITYSEVEGVVCFTSGTLIKTQTGECPIEALTSGDMVLTMDHGYQPIRWIGSSKRKAEGDMAPILIRKGALGNDRDLRVSPQHRMLLQGWQAELLYGEMEVLATAKSLVNDHSIVRVEGGEVEYFHMLFDTHEIIWAEGSPSESFHPGEQGWRALDQATRDEILTLFPQLAGGAFEAYGPSARTSLKHSEGALLGEYIVEALA